MTRNDFIAAIQFVIDNAQYVTIDEAAIEKFVKEYHPVELEHWRSACPFAYQDFEKIEDEVDFRFIVDSMAFCFWGYPEKWTVRYKGLPLDGWWAMLAVFKQAIEQGIPALNGAWLAGMSLEDTGKLFNGSPEIPLLRERWQILKGIGEELATKYHGRFWNFLKGIREIRGLELVEKIVTEFPGFNDVHEYKGRKVFFYKKAQLLVNDLWKLKGVEAVVQIVKLEELTGKADYKIPALLRKFGILKYTDELAEFVDNRRVIERGSEMEIEIRAGMLWATRLLSQQLRLKDPNSTPIQLDNVLWVMSQSKSQNDKPYHLTTTVDY